MDLLVLFVTLLLTLVTWLLYWLTAKLEPRQ
jgi:hypothetical protein